jgi:hypothetical protein
VIHRLVTEWAGKAPVKQLCRVLQASRSGYYAGRQRAQRPPQTCTQGLQATAVFEASGRTYGSRRLSSALRAECVDVGRHRCRTLIIANALKPTSPSTLDSAGSCGTIGGRLRLQKYADAASALYNSKPWLG